MDEVQYLRDAIAERDAANERLRAALEKAVLVMSRWLTHGYYGPQEQYRAMAEVRDNARKALANEEEKWKHAYPVDTCTYPC